MTIQPRFIRKRDAPAYLGMCEREFSRTVEPHIKVIYVNDGPGLLLGSMWNDYAYIEDQWPGRVKVVTLRMVPDRITAEWLRS